MNRYINSEISTEESKSRSYSSTSYPYMEPRETDIYIYVNSGDRLDLLAQRYYNDTRYWWVIASNNEGIGNGTFSIPPGTRLRIPYPLDESDIRNALQEAKQSR